MGQPVIQWQILSKEPEKTAQFYATLFDWTVDANNALNYRRLDTGSDRGISGGVWPSPPEGHNFVQLFVQVEDMAAAVDRARELGAGVIIPPQKLPDGEEMAILMDPQGMSFGLVRKP